MEETGWSGRYEVGPGVKRLMNAIVWIFFALLTSQWTVQAMDSFRDDGKIQLYFWERCDPVL